VIYAWLRKADTDISLEFLMWKITVDDDKCTGCSECVDSCPGEVYELKDGKAVPVDIDECHGCHTCEAVCDEDACQVEEEN
jgi:NAD-dependent dihydropyrimidine dehydrogenase PreA subunit